MRAREIWQGKQNRGTGNVSQNAQRYIFMDHKNKYDFEHNNLTKFQHNLMNRIGTRKDKQIFNHTTTIS